MMNRREALQRAGLVAAVAALGTRSAQAETVMNRMEMKPKDPSKLVPFELKHTPEITLGEKDAQGYTAVHITVGQDGIIHPSTADHWIDFISLYADGKLVGKSVLEAEISRGAVSFGVKLDGIKTFTAKAGCNLHGIWTGELVI
jgi:superoxide reductase